MPKQSNCDPTTLGRETDHERRMMADGFRDALERVGGAVEARLTRELLTPATEALAALRASYEGHRQAGHMHAALAVLTDETLALLTLRLLIQSPNASLSPARGVALVTASRHLGQVIAAEIATRSMIEGAPTYSKVETYCSRFGNSKKLLATVKKRFGDWITGDYTEECCLKIGEALITAIVEKLPRYFAIILLPERGKSVYRVTPTEELEEWFAVLTRDHAMMHVHRIPMIIPPKPWESGDPDGGYYVIREPIMRQRSRLDNHTLRAVPSELTLKALNGIQDTAWRINSNTWEVFSKVFANLIPMGGVVMGALPQRFRPKRLPDEEWIALSDEQRSEIKVATRRGYEQYDEDRAAYGINSRLFTIGAEMVKHDRIWFPHNMDWRGRIYPIPVTLNPQSNDLSKGLLHFADGVRLGSSGLWWLMYAFASAAERGVDKLPAGERVMWTIQNEDAIRRMVSDPLKDTDWLKWSKPWQALALAHELHMAFQEDNPENFVSHLPVNLDGTCNGVQHLSLMSRDLVGAESTNCRNKPERFDLYSDVGSRLYHALLVRANNGCEIAAAFLPRIETPENRRDVVKRSVMTVPYGVTRYGVRDFMLTDGHVSGLEDQIGTAKVLMEEIFNAIDTAMEKGRELQNYFAEVAKTLAKAGKPLTWDTPVGTRISQAYRKADTKRIKTLMGTMQISIPTADGALDPRRMASGAPPNVVHSCDAAHMQLTVARLMDQGVTQFSMIHDSYGVPAAHVSLMQDTLRQSVYDIYKDNYLSVWSDSVARYSGMTIPTPPPLGDYDIREVLESEYFFS